MFIKTLNLSLNKLKTMKAKLIVFLSLSIVLMANNLSIAKTPCEQSCDLTMYYCIQDEEDDYYADIADCTTSACYAYERAWLDIFVSFCKGDQRICTSLCNCSACQS